MKPPTYEPPYDSPIEDIFAKNAEKYLSCDVDLNTQVEAKTICGMFRLDFVAIANNGVVTGFECDGKEYHEGSRDEWRDAIILGAGKVDEIYRIKGKDLVYQPEDIFCLISKWSPSLFDERQIYNLSRISSESIGGASVSFDQSELSITSKIEGDESGYEIVLSKRHKNISEGKHQFWQSAFQFAQKCGGGNLDDVMSKFRK